MITLNEKGVFSRKLTVYRQGYNTSVTTLSNVFIKNALKYTVTVQSFITNNIPPLWLGEKNILTIHPKNDMDDEVEFFEIDDSEFDIHVLTLSNVFSIPQLVVEIQQFFHRFSLLMSALAVNEEANLTDVGDDFVDHVFVGCDAMGVLTLNFSSAFLSEYYITIPQAVGKTIGLHTLYYGSTANNGDTQTYPTTPFFGIDILTGLAVHTTNANCDVPISFRANRSVYNIDERLSLDVYCTLPHTNIISSFDGVETHDHVLARFNIRDYISTTGSNELVDSKLLSDITFDDKLQVGTVDLVRGSREIQAVTMLPGVIQAVNTSLFTRYLTDGKIVTSPVDVSEDGFWRLALLFTKKTT